VITATLRDAAAAVRSDYGTGLGGVRIRATGCDGDTTCDQIEFTVAGATETPPIPWQDRPTFQQVVELPAAPAAATPTPTPAATAAASPAATAEPVSTRAPRRRERATASPSPAGDSREHGGSLPFTGLQLGGMALLGAAALAGGLVARRRLR
jgi:hypothetical protein